MNILRRILLTLLFLPVLASAENGVALKDDNLRSEPFSDAKTAGVMSRGEKLQILAKQGAWLRIKSPKAEGWVRLLSVSRGEPAASGKNSDLLALSSGRAGTGQVVSTTGVRGLSEEELKAAHFSEPEIQKMEANGISAQNAAKFAAEAGLQARKVDYLPDPREGGKP